LKPIHLLFDVAHDFLKFIQRNMRAGENHNSKAHDEALNNSANIKSRKK
jgi:hypothetical protein